MVLMTEALFDGHEALFDMVAMVEEGDSAEVVLQELRSIGQNH